MLENGKLHKLHLYADVGISLMALVGLLGYFGIFDLEEYLKTWFNVDFIFHIIIIISLGGMILAERILHKHKGVIGR